MNGSTANRPRLGDVFVERGLVSDEELEDALLEQRVSRKRLGAILVSNGIVTPPDLTAALVTQLELSGIAGTGDPARDATETGDRPQSPRRKIFRRRSAADDGASMRDEPAHAVAREDTRRAAEIDAAVLAVLRDLEEITKTHLDALRHQFEQAGLELEAARTEIATRNRRIAELETRLQVSERERHELALAVSDEIRRLKTPRREFQTTR
jgi:hypothetical protein